MDIRSCAIVAGRVAFMPFRAFSYTGRLINRHVFPHMDKTGWGQYVAQRCHRVGGGCFVGCDLGYIGFAVENLHGGSLQLAGALATIPAHVVTTLLGDREPFALQLLDKACASRNPLLRQGAKRLRVSVRKLAQQDHYIIPLVWGLLSLNGFSMAAAVFTHSVQAGGDPALHVMQNVLQFAQGSAIFMGCAGLAANQYLLRSIERRAWITQTQRVNRQRIATAIGEAAVELLSSCTVLTAVTAAAFGSPSLAYSATAAFMGNYCQSHMRRAPNQTLMKG